MSGAALGHLAGIFLIFGGQYGHLGHLGIRARFLCGFLAPDLATFWGLRDDHGHRIWAIWPRIFGWAIWPFGANWPRFCHISGCALAFPPALPARHPPTHARHFCSAIATASSSLYAAHLIIHVAAPSAAGFPLHAVRMYLDITLLYLQHTTVLRMGYRCLHVPSLYVRGARVRAWRPRFYIWLDFLCPFSGQPCPCVETSAAAPFSRSAALPAALILVPGAASFVGACPSCPLLFWMPAAFLHRPWSHGRMGAACFFWMPRRVFPEKKFGWDGACALQLPFASLPCGTVRGTAATLSGRAWVKK